jgi:hypothetical protein
MCCKYQYQIDIEVLGRCEVCTKRKSGGTAIAMAKQEERFGPHLKNFCRERRDRPNPSKKIRKKVPLSVYTYLTLGTAGLIAVHFPALATL